MLAGPHPVLRAAALLPLLCAIAAPLGCDPQADARESFADTGDDESSDDDGDVGEPPAHDHGPAYSTETPVTNAGARRDVAIDRACTDYCDAYDDACADSSAYLGTHDCQATCRAWTTHAPQALAATVECRRAMLPGGDAGPGSCIAAGPDSPICVDPPSE